MLLSRKKGFFHTAVYSVVAVPQGGKWIPTSRPQARNFLDIDTPGEVNNLFPDCKTNQDSNSTAPSLIVCPGLPSLARPSIGPLATSTASTATRAQQDRGRHRPTSRLQRLSPLEDEVLNTPTFEVAAGTRVGEAIRQPGPFFGAAFGCSPGTFHA